MIRRCVTNTYSIDSLGIADNESYVVTHLIHIIVLLVLQFLLNHTQIHRRRHSVVVVRFSSMHSHSGNSFRQSPESPKIQI